jgi:modification methylase
MTDDQIPLDQIIMGDCLRVLKTIPEKTADLVFADPPYNLQLENELWRPNSTKVSKVDVSWDQFTNFEAYDHFTEEWLLGCRRVLKDTGTIWVIGSYHNIFRVGRIMQDLEFWILNDIVWIKNNPMPNFHGVRFTNAHETLIWAQKIKGYRYTFNYKLMKSINQSMHSNDGLQMRSDWKLPLCTGKERLKINIVLDPFFGTGTTGAVAKKLDRHWIGIEADTGYISIAQQRINSITPVSENEGSLYRKYKGKEKRIPFINLLQKGKLKEGQVLFFGQHGDRQAHIMADGHIRCGENIGSIHKVGRDILKAPCNGWMAWYYIDEKTGMREPINLLRKTMQNEMHLEDKPDTGIINEEE